MGLLDGILGGVTGFLTGGPAGAVAGGLNGLFGGGGSDGGGGQQGGGNQNEGYANAAQAQQMALARQVGQNAQGLFGSAQPGYGPLLNLLQQRATSPSFGGPAYSQNWGDYGGAAFGQGAPTPQSFYGPLMGAVLGNYGLGQAQGYQDPFLATQSSPFGFSHSPYGTPSSAGPGVPQQSLYGSSPWGIPNGGYGAPSSSTSSAPAAPAAIPGLPSGVQPGSESEAQRLAFAQANPSLGLMHGWGQAGNKEAIEGAMTAALQHQTSSPAQAPGNYMDALRGLQNAGQSGPSSIDWNNQPFGNLAGNPKTAQTVNQIGQIAHSIGGLLGGLGGGGGGGNAGSSLLGGVGGNNVDLGGNYSVQLPFGEGDPMRGPGMFSSTSAPTQPPIATAAQSLTSTAPVGAANPPSFGGGTPAPAAPPAVQPSPVEQQMPRMAPPATPQAPPATQVTAPSTPNLTDRSSGGGVGTNPLFGLYNLPQQQLQFLGAQHDLANQQRIEQGNLLAAANRAGVPGGGNMLGGLTQLAANAQSNLGNFRNQLAVNAPEQQWQHSLQAEQMAQQIQQFNQQLQQQRYMQGQELGTQQYQFGQNFDLQRLNQLLSAMGPGLNAGTAGLGAANVLGNAAATQYGQSQYANGLLGSANSNQGAANAIGGQGGYGGYGGFGTPGINGGLFGGGYGGGSGYDPTYGYGYSPGTYGATLSPGATAPINF